MSVAVLRAAHARPSLLLAPALAAITLLLVIPVLITGMYSFWTRTPTGLEVPELQLSNWTEFFTDNFYHFALWQTFRIAAITTLVCITLGYIPAYFVANTRFRHKVLLLLLLMLPFWISYIIRTLSWIHVLGVSGIVNVGLLNLAIAGEPLRMLYTETSVVMGLVHYLLPFMILNIYVSLVGIDPNLTAAARTLGCTGWQAFREVTLPLSVPGLAAGSLLCFVLAAGSYITPLILGGPDDFLFANLIFESIIIQLDWPFGATLAMVLLVLLGTVVLIYSRYMGMSRLFKSLG